LASGERCLCVDVSQRGVSLCPGGSNGCWVALGGKRHTANIQLIDHELHGLTARFDDETAIGAAFLRLFCNPLLLEQTGTASRKRVLENYSVQKVIVRYEAMFRDAIASANPHVERVGIDPVR
jgi:hypothetical protein